MKTLILIRHGLTRGNLEKRYVGRTDEGLCTEGKNELKGKEYPKAEIIFTSPMIRCIETAKIIYPEYKREDFHILADLRETNFGDFEGKNFEELKENPNYQRWVNSYGNFAIEGMESLAQVKDRVISAFRFCMKELREKQIETAAMVIHGGTIMTIMDCFVQPKEDFYHWQVENGCGYIVKFQEADWVLGNEYSTVAGKF